MTATVSRRTLAALLSATALAVAVPATAQEKTFALVQINQQALFFNQMNEGAQAAADAAGVEPRDLQRQQRPGRAEQRDRDLHPAGRGRLAVVAIDVNGIMPAVEQAAAAGIPVVAIDAILPEARKLAQIGVDNAAAGADLGAFFNEYAKGRAGPSSGSSGRSTPSSRTSARTASRASWRGRRRHHRGHVDGQNVQDTALSAAENLMTANPDMTAIYATGEPALLGAVAAVESQGRQADVKVFGWDLTASAIAGIDAGYVVAVIQQDPAGMGAAAVDALVTITGGGTVERHLGARDHRHQGERGRLPGDVPMTPGAIPGGVGGRGGHPPRHIVRRWSRCAASARPSGRIEALRGVDLDVLPGECLGLSATTRPASRR
jgi:ribose transport system substrate-binding protein